MKGGTAFHFVTEGPEEALARARAAAGDRDVRIGGGVATVRQYLSLRAIDGLHLAISPVFLGRGEALFAGLDLRALGYRCTRAWRESVPHTCSSSGPGIRDWCGGRSDPRPVGVSRAAEGTCRGAVLALFVETAVSSRA